MDRDNTIAMSDSKRASAFAHYSPFALLPDKTILTRYLNPKSRFALSQTLQSLFEEEDRADSLLPELNSMNPIVSLGSPLEPLLSSKDMFDKSMIENKGSILASGAPFSLASALVSNFN